MKESTMMRGAHCVVKNASLERIEKRGKQKGKREKKR